MRRRTTGFTSSLGRTAAALTLALAGIAASAARSQDLPERLPGIGSSDLQNPLLSEAAHVACCDEVMDADPGCRGGDGWCQQILPDGLIYPSYLAGVKESRIAAKWMRERERGWIWDVTLGGRVGIVRYGSCNPLRPEGWQLDMEGAVFPRLDIANSLDVEATDYRYGVPLTYGRGAYQMKLAFYHLSSHLGDELMLRDPTVPRINFCRDAVVWGHSFYPTDDLRLYAEVGLATRTDGGNEPWEFQFGFEYSRAGPTGTRPVPFLAVNTHLRQEVGFGGNVSVQTGWLWRGASGHMARAGLHYFNGKSDQFEFYNHYESKVGLALWYDY